MPSRPTDGRTWRRPALRAFAIAALVHVALYAWWVRADMLLSDDYSFFDPEETFAAMEEWFFRPLYRMAALALRDAALSAPDAIVWLKAVHLLLSATFVGTVAAFFAATSRAAWVGVAAGLLASTSLGQQTNSVWFNIGPQFPTYILAVVTVWCIAAAARRTAAGAVLATAAMATLLAASMFLYQMAPFYMVGLVAAYLVLTTDDDRTTARTTLFAAAAVLAAVVVYAVALRLAVDAGMIAGRAASATALGAVAGRLPLVRPELAFAWGYPLLAPRAAAGLLAMLILAGGAVALVRSRRRGPLALRWIAAAGAAGAAIHLPAALNDFQAAERLYIPGALAVAGFAIAAAAAIWDAIGQGPLRTPLAVAGAGALAGAAVTASTATVVGIGLPHHAEVQHVRTQLAVRPPGETVGVYVIRPAKGTPFWARPGNAGKEGLYLVGMSTYHPWTGRGIVRFALRHADPGHAIPVTVSRPGSAPPAGWTIVDMLPFDRALDRIAQ